MKITSKDIPMIVAAAVLLGGLTYGGYVGYQYYTIKENMTDDNRDQSEQDLEKYKTHGMYTAGAVVVGIIAVIVLRMKKTKKSDSDSDDECDLDSDSVCQVDDDSDSEDDDNKTNILTF